jgi:ketol-acid reductoisomerase
MGLESLQSKTVAILGYGNQGRAHALNLRDSGVSVLVGARAEGKGWKQAQADGFPPLSFAEAAAQAHVIAFLLPDQIIAPVFRDLAPVLEKETKWIGFAHGFAYYFGGVPQLPNCGYFLAAPKGAGALLRARFEAGQGLPTVFAVANGSCEATRKIAEAYARAIAGKTPFIRETTFQLETEGDLFGEQVVLVGGILELMRSAFETLVRNGHPPEMAFFDVCQEVQATVDLFLSSGPVGITEKISPTALYGAATRGPRVIGEKAKEEMQKIFEEIRTGTFANELLEEFKAGSVHLKSAKERDRDSTWEKAFQTTQKSLGEDPRF